MILYELEHKGYINQKGTIFLVETDQLIEGVSFFFAEEERKFWSKLKLGDELKFRYDISPKFGTCALLSHVNNEDVSTRRILIHGANEDGKCTCANSANCLVPIKTELIKSVEKIRGRIPLDGYTKSWVRMQFERGYKRVVKMSEIKRVMDEN